MINLCRDCPDRSECKALCAKAIRYVDQDQVKKLIPGRLNMSLPLDEENVIEIPTPEGHYHEIEAMWAYITKSPLSDRTKEILRLYFKEGFTQQEIGDKFGITQQAVELQIKRAIKKLREGL